MAMVKCAECQREISSTAAACPHCGAKPKAKTSGCAWIALFAIATPCLIGVFMTPFLRQQEANQRAAERKAIESLPPDLRAKAEAQLAREAENKKLESEAFLAIPRAKRRVEAALKDPDSARFGRVWAVRTPEGKILVCGNVNSKNSFGGYTGDKGFTWDGASLAFEESNPNFVVQWNATCAKWETIATD